MTKNKKTKKEAGRPYLIDGSKLTFSIVPEAIYSKIPQMSSVWVYMLIDFYRVAFLYSNNASKIEKKDGMLGMKIKKKWVLEDTRLFPELDYRYGLSSAKDIMSAYKKLERAHKELIQLGLIQERNLMIWIPEGAVASVSSKNSNNEIIAEDGSNDYECAEHSELGMPQQKIHGDINDILETIPF